MHITSESLSGPAFAKRIGLSVDNLYDWRRRGIDLGAAAAVNSRKHYSLYDVFEALVLMHLRIEHYGDIARAFRRSRSITPFVLKQAGIDGAPSLKVDSIGRYAFFDGKDHFYMSDDPAAHIKLGSDIVEVIDLKAIATSLGEKFKAEISK